jgi:hypothetical protein
MPKAKRPGVPCGRHHLHVYISGLCDRVAETNAASATDNATESSTAPSITALPCLGCEDESQEFSKLVQGHLLCRIIRIHPVNNHDI